MQGSRDWPRRDRQAATAACRDRPLTGATMRRSRTGHALRSRRRDIARRRHAHPAKRLTAAGIDDGLHATIRRHPPLSADIEFGARQPHRRFAQPGDWPPPATDPSIVRLVDQNAGGADDDLADEALVGIPANQPAGRFRSLVEVDHQGAVELGAPRSDQGEQIKLSAILRTEVGSTAPIPLAG